MASGKHSDSRILKPQDSTFRTGSLNSIHNCESFQTRGHGLRAPHAFSSASGECLSSLALQRRQLRLGAEVQGLVLDPTQL